MVMALALVVCASACVSPPAPPRLVIATGGAGGIYDRIGEALAALLRSRLHASVTVLRTAASVENLKLVGDGGADIGFASVDAAALAVAGSAPFTRPLPIQSFMRLYDEYLHVVVRADGPARDIGHLSGLTLSTGASESGTQLLAERVVEGVGAKNVTRIHLGVAESARALENGRIQGFFFTSGLPTPAIADLARRVPIRLLACDQLVEPFQTRYDNVYLRRLIPSLVYGLPADTPTIGVPNLLVVNSRMDHGLARRITELVFQSRDELIKAHVEARNLHERTATRTFPIALHTGAVDYYRDQKIS
ncbi:TAXI family TRAP transporter solute-binding subunit [Microbispora sp. NPDC088329]|uniref:TAXI family TRAP transporter solute-binding subunit n=1 Tax=Microbispora sp. NPDC088329 TaxID=3154869 RepID=UPI00344129E6